MTNGIRKRFCVRCGRLVNLDADIGAVELERGAGIMCGADVEKLIAEIYSARETTPFGHMPKSLRPSRQPEPRGEWL